MERVAIIKNVLTTLNKEGVNYCVLRNYDFLLEEREPKKHSERSIDLAVHKDDYKKFHQEMVSLGFTKRKNPSFSLKHVPYFLVQGGEVISFDVQVGGVHWNDMCYLEDELFENRIKKSFFYVPSDDNVFVMLIAHSILGKRRFKPEYKEIIINLSNKIDKNYVKQKLSEIFNKKLAEELLHSALKGDFDKILKKKYFLISNFIFKSKKNTITFTKLFLRWIKWKKIGHSYPLISIIGPDGSGKSTMTKELYNYLKEDNRKVELVYNGRGRNQILPFRKIGRIYKSKERKKDREVKPNNKDVKKRKIFYTLAAPIFTLDLLLRYFFRILPKRKNKSVVITDRYCSDILLMENVSFKFRKFLLKLFPKPTLTFYFYNDPEILHQRRPEESIDGLKRQMYYFDKLKDTLNTINLKSDDKKKNQEIVLRIVKAYLLDNWY